MTASNTERLLSVYDTLSRTTGCMVLAAQRGDWERLARLEKDCAQIVAELSALEAGDGLAEDMAPRKAELIRKVLADDRAIRDITEPWLKRLESQLGANRREQRLLGAYGPPRMN